MQSFVAWIKRHPVLSYYLLVFAISWSLGILVLGPAGFIGIDITPDTQLLLGVPVGILGPFIAGLVFIGLLYGRQGLRDLWSRLRLWRVGVGWYIFALITAPLITVCSLLARSTTPAIVTAPDKAGVLLLGIGIGLVAALFEEVGWTGFAIPELRKRFGVLITGLMMGVLWGLWHYPAFSASGRASAPLSPVIFTVVLLFTWLIPYRILMVWLYDHTRSVLMAVIMHMPIVASSFVLSPRPATSTFTATGNIIFASALWIIVAVIYGATRGRLEARAKPLPA